LFEHRNLKKEISATKGHGKTFARLKLGLLWSLPILAFVGAASSQWGSEQLEKAATKNDPLNAPINSASAVLRLKVKGVEQLPWNTPGSGVFEPPPPGEESVYGNGGISLCAGTNLSRQLYTLGSGLGDIQ